MKPFYTLNKTSLGETGCLRNLFYLLAAKASSFFNSPPFVLTVSQDTFGTLPLTVQYLTELRDDMPCHCSPSTSHPSLPSEADHFPMGGKNPNKDVPLSTFLAYL